ncbi:MAG: Tom37 metaxin N-terminal-like domain-containing protein, partial [Saprospiraceae bacterium]|nr:Tom37 metaxin N-terminal-like domain-containing protein [Saprospiraceae bacterium]
MDGAVEKPGIYPVVGRMTLQRAIATAVTRMLEDHLYWAITWDRWMLDEHWALTRRAYFGWMPAPLRWL